MDDLIAKLEAATEGSRELDAEIENILAGGSDADLAYILEDIERTTRPPHYTTSLDAAATLIPEGSIWCVQTDWSLPGRASISIDSHIRDVAVRADAATPALALTIACIRAMVAV